VRRTVLYMLFVLFLSGIPLSLSFAQSSPAEKQSGPTLEETEAWIKQTFYDGSHVWQDTKQEVDFYQKENPPCTLQFLIWDGPTSVHIRASQFVSLSDLDPDSFVASELIHDTDYASLKDPNLIDPVTGAVKDHPYVYVKVKTANGKDSVSSTTYIKAKNGKDEQIHAHETEIGLGVKGIALEPQYAPRFIKALRHAVELCGGKPSLF
jgi:hypothetical protein